MERGGTGILHRVEFQRRRRWTDFAFAVGVEEELLARGFASEPTRTN